MLRKNSATGARPWWADISCSSRGRGIPMQPVEEDPTRQVLVARAGRATDPSPSLHRVRGLGGAAQEDVERGGEGLWVETS